MPEFSFITNHGLVLLAIAKRPRSTAREIGDVVGITERATHSIINDLEAAGYITKTRVGRRNEYVVDPDMPVKVKTSDADIGELLMLLGWKPGKRRGKAAPSEEGKNF